MTENVLKELYYNPKQGYLGINKLYKKAIVIDKNIKRKNVKDWLNKEEAYQLNKSSNNKKEYIPIISMEGDSYQLDLSFLPKYKKQNRGYYIILMCININTRKLYGYKAKNKKVFTILEMLNQFWNDTDGKIKTVTTDNGSEFTAQSVKEWIEDKEIQLYFSDVGDKNKMGKVERVNRTIKEKMERHFLATGKVVWYNIFDDLIKNYNNTYHSSIKMTPNEVNKKKERRIIEQAIDKTNEILNKRNYMIYHPVRIRLKKKKFDKGTRKYSDELYEIIDITNTGRLKVRNLETGGVLRRTILYEDIQPVIEEIPPPKINKQKKVVKFISEAEKRASAERKQRKELKQLQIDMKGKGFYDSVVNSLPSKKDSIPLYPGEKHIPLYTDKGFKVANYAGPGTQVIKRLEKNIDALNATDKTAMRHDIDYTLSTNKDEVRDADNRMINNLSIIENDNLDYKINTKIVKGAMKTKTWLEDRGFWNKGSYSTMNGNNLSNKDRALLLKKREELTQQGYSIKKSGIHILLDEIILRNKK